MGYDLHITRADEWEDAEDDPIPLDEWVAFARGWVELTETDALDDGTGAPVFILGDDPAVSAALYWSGGRIKVRGADESYVPPLVDIALALDSVVLGDDGEAYE